MKEPMEMIKFFAVNQKLGKRIKEGKMVTVDYPFKYTQQDLDAVREAVIAEVLEIIDSSIEDVEALTTGREGAVSEERKEGMLLEARVIRVCVENLKGGEQE